jgi:hypothetical protein
LKAKEAKSTLPRTVSLTLPELLSIASAGYPDEYLRVYYHADTGEFDETGGGDTLAAFIVREIQQSFDAALAKSEQLQEVGRLLRNAILQIEGVIASIDGAIAHAATDEHGVASWENEGGK